MNRIDAPVLAYLLLEICKVESKALFCKINGEQPAVHHVVETKQLVEQVKAYCTLVGWSEAEKGADAALHYLTQPMLTYSAMQVVLNRLKADVTAALDAREFVVVQADRSGLIDAKSPFGEDVERAFPSASRDISEGLNCLAVECPSAAVFHLMRAAEVGLRALARDRGVEFSDKPLEQKEWGQILTNLDSKVKSLRERPNSDWKGATAKDEQVRYFAEIVQELRSFNDCWRRHVSHADPTAFYDRDQALSVKNHVETFFRKLALKISESTASPEIRD